MTEHTTSTPEQEHISVGTRILAFFCAMCPFCVVVRCWPDSRFAKWWKKVQQRCLFCHAYRKVKHITVEAQGAPAAQQVPVNRVGAGPAQAVAHQAVRPAARKVVFAGR